MSVSQHQFIYFLVDFLVLFFSFFFFLETFIDNLKDSKPLFLSASRTLIGLFEFLKLRSLQSFSDEEILCLVSMQTENELAVQSLSEERYQPLTAALKNSEDKDTYL